MGLTPTTVINDVENIFADSDIEKAFSDEGFE